MATFEAKDRPVLVFVDTYSDLANVRADLVRTKYATVISTGKNYVIPPNGTAWEEVTNAVMEAVDALDTKVNKYDDLIGVIKITDATTTMAQVAETLDTVNTDGDHVVFDVSGLNAGMYLCTIYLGHEYYRIADLVTGFEATGFFKHTDLLKDIILGGSSGEDHYTVMWDQNTNQCTRLNAAESITTDTTNFKHFGSVNENYDNPFDDIYPWSGRKLCNIDLDLYRSLVTGNDITDCVVAWEGDANFSYEHQYGVWVYTPPFFGMSYVLGNYRYFDVTQENTPNNIYYKPRITGRWQGVDVELTIDGTTKICNLPTVGVPISSIALSTQHTYAKNYGGTLVNIYDIDASSLLYIVEYANTNIQNMIGDGCSSLHRESSDLFKAASTNSNVVHVENISAISSNIIPGAIMDIGTSNGGKQIGRYVVVSSEQNASDNTILDVTLNEAVTVTTSNYWAIHGTVNLATEDIGSASGFIGTNGKANAFYRGEVLYGNRFQYILGAYRQTGTANIWTCDEDTCDDYDALNTAVHHDTGLTLASASGYVKTFGMAEGFSFPPFCTESGGSATAPIGDYVYVPATTSGNTILLFGGYSNSGAGCGFCGYWNAPSGTSYWNSGSRPSLKTP